MRIIKPTYNIIDSCIGQYGNAVDIVKLFYKDTDDCKYPNDFVNKAISNMNLNLLEHCTIYLDIESEWNTDKYSTIGKYIHESNAYVVGPIHREDDNEFPHAYITTSLKTIIENNWNYDLKYQCIPTEYHYKRITFHFIGDNCLYNELSVKTKFAFTKLKNEFTEEVEYVAPEWVNLYHYGCFIDSIGNNEVFVNGEETELYDDTDDAVKEFLYSIKYSEDSYLYLVNHNGSHDKAKYILPNAVKTEFLVTGYANDWLKILESMSNTKFLKTVYNDISKKYQYTTKYF